MKIFSERLVLRVGGLDLHILSSIKRETKGRRKEGEIVCACVSERERERRERERQRERLGCRDCGEFFATKLLMYSFMLTRKD